MKIMSLVLSLLMLLSPITVGPSGQNYTSFTQAVYEHVDDGRPIIVYPGTYDIKKEYECLFGDKVKNMNDQTDLNMFQYGIQIKNRIVYFMPGAKLTCKWYFPTNFTARFCPIYMVTNATVYGMDLYAEGTMYAIHDDIWNIDEVYTNEYYFCKVVGRKLFNANCIGGGVGKNARHIISNCYFDNGVPGSVTVRYHNNTFPDSTGDIYVSNSYFNGILAFNHWGPATNVLNVYVNNCKAEDITTGYEGSDFHYSNINLHVW